MNRDIVNRHDAITGSDQRSQAADIVKIIDLLHLRHIDSMVLPHPINFIVHIAILQAYKLDVLGLKRAGKLTEGNRAFLRDPYFRS